MYINIGKVEMIHVFHNNVALRSRRLSEHGTSNRDQRLYRKFWTRYIQTFLTTLMKSKLGFLVTDGSRHF